jgi:Zn-dependent M32 family carboxypeptidase
MDFLEQRGLPLTEENLATWQEDLEAREQAAKQRNQELRNARAEVVRDFNQLKSKEAELFRARATKSRRVWSRSRFDLFKRFGYNLYEIIIAVNVLMFILSRIVPGLLDWFAFSGINVTYLNEYYRFIM